MFFNILLYLSLFIKIGIVVQNNLFKEIFLKKNNILEKNLNKAICIWLII